MCIVFAYQGRDEAEVAFVVAANRDEYLHRPASTAYEWPNSNIFAGQDLTAKGTWFGMTASKTVPQSTDKIPFKFGIITNKGIEQRLKEDEIYDEKKAESFLSRGNLIVDYLKTDTNDFLKNMINSRTRFTGYNLLLGDLKTNRLRYYHDRLQSYENLENDRVYGLSNALLDTDWIKVREGKKQVNDIIRDMKLSEIPRFTKKKITVDLEITVLESLEKLMEVLCCNQKYSPEEETLYNAAHLNLTATYVDAFQVNDNDIYATRYQSALIVLKSGVAYFKERVLNTKSMTWEDPVVHKLYFNG